ncbi:class B sortase [Lachnospira sp.]|uniref:class B sortase n=1 Tax=Lachnospira sp. TaxID=2049031 RepID=UPI00257FA3C0|nr:class B sortase [Lachnospira sp.]
MGDNNLNDKDPYKDDDNFKDDDIYVDEEDTSTSYTKVKSEEEEAAELEFEKKEAKKKRNRIINRVILVVAACVFVFAAYNLISILLEYKKGTDTYKKVEDDVIQSEEQTIVITDENGQQSSVDIPFVYDEEALKAINSYAIGYIYIPSIDIRLPMVQYTDNDYYLHHLIDGTYNSSGCLFEDSRIDGGINASHVIIYGHNMKNGSMFGLLKYYNSESYYRSGNNDKIYIYTGNELREYTIFSCYVSEPISDTYTYNFSTLNAMRTWASQMQSQSLYDTGVDISNSQQVITLSTCTNDGKQRFIVHASLTGSATIDN